MEWELVDKKEAPTPPKAVTKETEETLRMLNALKPGKVAKVKPAEGQSIRGLKVTIGRVASNNIGKNLIKTWDVDGIVYVERVK